MRPPTTSTSSKAEASELANEPGPERPSEREALIVLHVAWLIPAFPLAGFVLLILGGKALGDPKAGWLATLMSAGAFAVTVVAFIGLYGRHADNRTFISVLYNWIPVGGFKIDAGLQLDQLSITMALFVTGVGTLIHLYSIGYMKGDPRFPRFFIYLNLFLFSGGRA
jgi:NADH-quinone oxidoreductase subunit L